MQTNSVIYNTVPVVPVPGNLGLDLVYISLQVRLGFALVRIRFG